MARNIPTIPLNIIIWDNRKERKNKTNDEVNRGLYIEAPLPYYPDERDEQPKSNENWRTMY